MNTKFLDLIELATRKLMFDALVDDDLDDEFKFVNTDEAIIFFNELKPKLVNPPVFLNEDLINAAIFSALLNNRKIVELSDLFVWLHMDFLVEIKNFKGLFQSTLTNTLFKQEVKNLDKFTDLKEKVENLISSQQQITDFKAEINEAFSWIEKALPIIEVKKASDLIINNSFFEAEFRLMYQDILRNLVNRLKFNQLAFEIIKTKLQ